MITACTVSAYDFIYGGIYYKIISEEDATCEIATEYDYEYPESPYSGYVTIPETVSNGYWGGKDYQVIGIGDWAFYNCQLDGISLPSTIEKIGNSSFQGCKGISTFTFPESIKYIGDNAFFDSDLAGSLYLPYCCKYIGNSAFYQTDITEFTVEQENSVSQNPRVIKGAAFGYCKSLRYVNLNQLYYDDFEQNPFMGCDNLKSIEGIGLYTDFTNWSTGNLIIDGCLYRFTMENNISYLKLVCCPAGKDTYASPNLYTDATNDPHILTALGHSAFAGCSKITLLDIPETVTKICDFALFMPFDYDATYRRVNIPESVEEIGQTPFGWFGSNWDIYLYSTHVTDIYSQSAPGDGSKYGTIHIPTGTLSSFGTEWTRKAFNIIDDIGVVTPKCATPTITFKDGMFLFSCETEGVEYVYEVSASGKSSGKLNPYNTYKISFYATKDGYENSDVVTKEMTVDETFVEQKGDLNGDGKIDIVDVTTLIDIILGKIKK